jgi:hypothetical protein
MRDDAQFLGRVAEAAEPCRRPEGLLAALDWRLRQIR